MIQIQQNQAENKEFTTDWFWGVIQEAKQQCGMDMDAEYDWLDEHLTAQGPEAALHFHSILHVYVEAADEYGLWDAAAMMKKGRCSEDAFVDFRAWLVAQGKDTYLAALKDPDTLADAEPYGGCCFEELQYVGDAVYSRLTDRSAFEDCEEMESQMFNELLKGIEFAPGIGYPRDRPSLAKHLPRLAAKYLTPSYLYNKNGKPRSSWNRNWDEVQELMEEGRQFDQQGTKRITLKLYSSLTAELDTGTNYDDYDSEPYMEQLDGADLVYYQEAILEGIDKETLPGEAERGLMEYFYGSERINKKVAALRVTAEVYHGKLYGVAVCELKNPLTGRELDRVKSFCTQQYADGWGEGYEQRPRKTMDGDLYVHFWQDKDFFIRTQQEMEQRRERQKRLGGEAR